MGINGFNAFMKKKAPKIYQKRFLSEFYGKKMVIDGHNILYKFKSAAMKQIVYKTNLLMEEPDQNAVFSKLIQHIFHFIYDLLKIGITPILVFDGEHPFEKYNKQEQRKNRKKKLVEDIKDLKNNKEMTTIEKIQLLKKKYANLIYVSKSDVSNVFDILTTIGIPCLYAIGEGEKLCAMLCREGKVEIVYSTDTDLSVFGTPIYIRQVEEEYNPKTQKYEKIAHITVFDPLLQSLQLSFSTFVDLCIMAGCDYNTNIKDIAIGKSYKLLTKYQSIDNLPSEYESKKSCLNTEFCRNIFKLQHSSNLISFPKNTNLTINKSPPLDPQILSKFNCTTLVQPIINLYSTLPEPLKSSFRPVQKVDLIL